MKINSLKGLFNSTNLQKILYFLVDNPFRELLGREIQKATAISRAGVYIALCELVKQGLVFKKQKGRFLLYSLNYEDSVIKQFKAFKNVLLLRPMVFKLKPFSKKIIFYGSASRGEDSAESDIDLFIVSKEPQLIKDAMSSIKTRRKVQPVVKTPSELPEFKEKEQVFWREVERGMVLWEEKE